jgi:nucleoside phosphorylase
MCSRAGAQEQRQYARDRPSDPTLSATHDPFSSPVAVSMPRATIYAAAQGYGVPYRSSHAISCVSLDCYFFATAVNITRVSAAGWRAEPAGK